MKVLIASSVSPFSARQEMYWAQLLEARLRHQGVQVDMFMLPTVADPLLLTEQMFAYRLLDATNSSHVLISVGYPAFVLRHPHKRVLLFSLASYLHQWYNTEYGILSSPQYDRIRQTVFDAERQCLTEAERIVCASRALASRLRQVHKLASTPMILDGAAELQEARLEENYNGFWVACESTLEPFERIDLLLNALVRVQEPCRLRLFIPSASDVYSHALEQQIDRLQLKARVTIVHASVSKSGLEGASALLAIPFAEMRIPDAVLLAIRCNLPVVTTSDSLALLEVVKHQQNGLVVDPSVHDLAEAIQKLLANQDLIKQLSKGTRHLVGKLASADLLARNLMK